MPTAQSVDDTPPIAPMSAKAALVSALAADGTAENEAMRTVRRRLGEVLLPYRFGLREMLTKVQILNEEMTARGEHNPIEHIKHRVKSIDSILDKMIRTDCAHTLEGLRDGVRDIAGLRITCIYTEDCYRMAQLLSSQPDVTVVEEKDYIAEPKESGYRSLHLIVEVPVFLSTGTVHVPVEIQIRTIAMDFWSSVEHELAYKFSGQLPQHLRDELRQIAQSSRDLDAQMTQIRADAHRAQNPSDSV
ncbi:GTP pyrophosphokinase family protein [Helcobacillus massiliensis]|uniref:GTP pyrophosphokinase n=1 Tax=Helcobacillus TaxID=1161125 RepID=UPI001EF605D1|nr:MULTISPECIES: GTP pyrophosphokinase family protein [Helcobacillus]MCG7427747.1 GTP pyrophosphokinase family protein [Helcobacillus sp. ACRRO]MCT1557888.1 GTP pyrophosphokinase family protein [Helcobacillus massiliensis]MCT2036512.1 GTP pyrophosphokinase family protein [Helcobacillus massiliensis]MCT2332587.1 GTP pyrophosphokinase family protein [Helcobacillus massiliensis]MDK7742765.1 GTP pyrophosphokinase family protein [Helcobacillus massiliensis]